MACRSSCTKDTPLSVTCSATVFRSWTCATRSTRNAVAFVAAPKNTRSHHLQIHGDVLLAVNGPNIWAMQQYATQQDYYAKSLIDSVQTEQPFAAGVRIFDISKPSSPREIAFLNMPGFGAHRIWWVGGHYAYVSVHFDGFIDHALAVIDVSDPEKPQLAGAGGYRA